MQELQMPADEIERLEKLRALKILESAPEERFDRLTRMAKRMFGVPISLVTLIDADRQWFKPNQGLELSETLRNIAFCGHAILDEEVFIVPNALEDERFHDNPLVTAAPQIRFYAGQPLSASNGHKMGISEDKLDVVLQQFQMSLRDYNKAASRGSDTGCSIGHVMACLTR